MGEPVMNTLVRSNADLIPARMCNELVYCPRLFYLEHVQGIFIESADTVEGSAQHRRAERRGKTQRGRSKKNDESDERDRTAELGDDLAEALPRRLAISSEAWGITGSIDMVEVSADRVVVVEAKRGKAPKGEDHRWGDHALPYRAWPADVAQTGLYMAVLRELGLPCDEARVFYRLSGDRVSIPWSHELELFLRDVVIEARRVAALPCPPIPLLNDRKCVGCSLHEACLPDEHHALLQEQGDAAPEVRRIVPGRDDRAIVHALSPGTVVRKDGDALLLCPRVGETQRVLIKDVAHLAVFGAVHVTEQCLRHLLFAGIPVSHHTGAGRIVGLSAPLTTVNVLMRRAQYRAADDPARCLTAAKAFVVAKIRNQRTILKRYRRGLKATLDEENGDVLPEWAGGVSTHEAEATQDAVASTAHSLRRMQVALRAAERANDIDKLRGHEGDAGAQYFAAFPSVLPLDWKADFGGRTRRPPRDRINAMLSFGYALLVRETTAALARIGLDPMLGLYHTMIPGRPALALDLMEVFRAAWVDAATLRLVATGGIDREDFHISSAGVMLSDRGRRAVIRAYERRGDELTTHPRFGYRMSYRRLVELEARVLAKWLVGEIETFTPLWTR